jgi:putative transposase
MSNHRFVDLKRIYIRDACYFVTSKTFRNFPFFREQIFCELFVENLRAHKKLKDFELYGWFLGFDHFHLAIRPRGKWNFSGIMQHLKRNFSHNVNIAMGYNVGANNYSRLREENCTMLNRYRIRFVLKYGNHNPYPKFQWQKSFYDHYCRNETDFTNCLEYIAYNPIKHSLPTNWSYVFVSEKYQDLNEGFGFRKS